MIEDWLVSIIVPVYQVEKYLNLCVKSIINQTYKNLEIILVDDGSTDNSPKLCDYWAIQDTRVRVIHKQNGGLSDARNVGLEASVGNYVAFIDSDDYITTDYIEQLLRALLTTESDIAICKYIKFLDGEERDASRNEIENTSYKTLKPEECFLKTDSYYDVAWNKLYKREVIGDIRYPYGKVHEDIFTTYKIVFSASKIVILNSELYYYRQRIDSITGGRSIPKIDIEEAFWQRLNFLKEKSMPIYIEAMTAYIINANIVTLNHKQQLKNTQLLNKIKKRYKYVTRVFYLSPSVTVLKKIKMLVRCIMIRLRLDIEK